MQVVLTGDEDLNRKLRELAGKEAKKAIRKASRKALKPIQQRAKALAPKGETGRLRRSIRIRSIKRSRSRIGSRVTTSTTDNVFTGRAYYGAFREFGHRIGAKASNKTLGVTRRKQRTVAQQRLADNLNASRTQVGGSRFMTRAADERKDESLRIYRFEISEFIKSVATS